MGRNQSLDYWAKVRKQRAKWRKQARRNLRKALAKKK